MDLPAAISRTVQDAGFSARPTILSCSMPIPRQRFQVPDLLPPKEISEVRLKRRRELRALVDDAVKDSRPANPRSCGHEFHGRFRLMTSEKTRVKRSPWKRSRPACGNGLA